MFSSIFHFCALLLAVIWHCCYSRSSSRCFFYLMVNCESITPQTDCTTETESVFWIFRHNKGQEQHCKMDCCICHISFFVTFWKTNLRNSQNNASKELNNTSDTGHELSKGATKKSRTVGAKTMQPAAGNEKCTCLTFSQKQGRQEPPWRLLSAANNSNERPCQAVIPLKQTFAKRGSIHSLSQRSLLSFIGFFISLLYRGRVWGGSDVFLNLMKLICDKKVPSIHQHHEYCRQMRWTKTEGGTACKHLCACEQGPCTYFFCWMINAYRHRDGGDNRHRRPICTYCMSACMLGAWRWT